MSRREVIATKAPWVSVGISTATSFLCGFAPNLGTLILFRVLQGLGGGGLAPVAHAILVDIFLKEKVGGAFALYSMAIVTAPAIGPPLGGSSTASSEQEGGACSRWPSPLASDWSSRSEYKYLI
jgi:MFS family permease